LAVRREENATQIHNVFTLNHIYVFLSNTIIFTMKRAQYDNEEASRLLCAMVKSILTFIILHTQSLYCSRNARRQAEKQ
jgi:hypothetical protein